MGQLGYSQTDLPDGGFSVPDIPDQCSCLIQDDGSDVRRLRHLMLSLHHRKVPVLYEYRYA